MTDRLAFLDSYKSRHAKKASTIAASDTMSFRDY